MNNIDLKGRTAIVTGGAQGIGLAITKRMIASGARVHILDRDEKLLASRAGPVYQIVRQGAGPDRHYGERRHAFAIPHRDPQADHRAASAIHAREKPDGAVRQGCKRSPHS